MFCGTVGANAIYNCFLILAHAASKVMMSITTCHRFLFGGVRDIAKTESNVDAIPRLKRSDSDDSVSEI